MSPTAAEPEFGATEHLRDPDAPPYEYDHKDAVFAQMRIGLPEAFDAFRALCVSKGLSDEDTISGVAGRHSELALSSVSDDELCAQAEKVLTRLERIDFKLINRLGRAALREAMGRKPKLDKVEAVEDEKIELQWNAAALAAEANRRGIITLE